MKAGRRRVIGLHSAESVLKNRADRIVNIWIDDQRKDARLSTLARRFAEMGIRPLPTGKDRLNALADDQNHQGVVVELSGPGELGENELREALENPRGLPFFLVLDHVQDPHNLGACLRTADAAGVQGVVLTKDQSAGITATVAKAASGATETVPIYRVTNLARALDWMKQSGIWLVGAAGEAGETVYEIDLGMALGLVIGAEQKGLRRLTRERCDLLARIPMAGRVESLNLSVATGVLLFEAARQRDMAGRAIGAASGLKT